MFQEPIQYNSGIRIHWLGIDLPFFSCLLLPSLLPPEDLDLVALTTLTELMFRRSC